MAVPICQVKMKIHGGNLRICGQPAPYWYKPPHREMGANYCFHHFDKARARFTGKSIEDLKRLDLENKE